MQGLSIAEVGSILEMECETLMHVCGLDIMSGVGCADEAGFEA